MILKVVFDRNQAVNYDKWFVTPFGQYADFLEKKLLRTLVPLRIGKTILDVGCGTGNYLLYFESLGMDSFGLDISLSMLTTAKKKLKVSRVFLGVAEYLPFRDNAIDFICFVTALEFLAHPGKALQEAARVAKKGIFLGVLNKYSLLTFQRRVKKPSHKSIYNHAMFYTIWDLRKLINQTCPGARIKWRSVLVFSSNKLRFLTKIEGLFAFRENPFGAFLGIYIDLM